MKLVVLALALGFAALPKVAAAVETNPLQLRAKAALMAPGAVPGHQSAPFVSPALSPEPDLDLAPRHEALQQRSHSSCATDSALCYDAGHIVFKPARRIMPDIPGLTRENISVKRDRIILRYSF
jgi:hypothetical protein